MRHKRQGGLAISQSNGGPAELCLCVDTPTDLEKAWEMLRARVLRLGPITGWFTRLSDMNIPCRLIALDQFAASADTEQGVIASVHMPSPRSLWKAFAYQLWLRCNTACFVAQSTRQSRSHDERPEVSVGGAAPHISPGRSVERVCIRRVAESGPSRTLRGQNEAL